MNKLFKITNKQIFPIMLILILALARLIPHPVNFTPVIAVAIMSGYFFKNIYLSFATLIISMLIADLFIGFYENMFFVYLSLLLISFSFYKLSKKINFKNLFIYGFANAYVEFDGFANIYAIIHGLANIYATFHGFANMYATFHGFANIYIKCHGFANSYSTCNGFANNNAKCHFKTYRKTR